MLPGDTKEGERRDGERRERLPGETASLPKLDRDLHSAHQHLSHHNILNTSHESLDPYKLLYLVSPSLSRGRSRLGSCWGQAPREETDLGEGREGR